MKTDVIRSIIARCDLLCEDLLQAEEEQGRLFSLFDDILSHLSKVLHCHLLCVVAGSIHLKD